MDSRYLLISDLDGTLLGDDPSLQRFADYVESHRDRLRLAYASGRFFESVYASIQTTALPAPEAVIGGVGTDVVAYPSGDRIESARLPVCDNWDREPVLEVLDSVPGLTPQPDRYQSRHKISFYLYDASTGQLQEIRRRLNDLTFRTDIIYSSDRDLDVVPAGVSKGSAAGRLAQAWGVTREAVLVSGDSGNDLSLFEQGFRGIVVANAHPVLRALKGGRIYHAQRPLAAGVLEGVEHWLSEKG